MLDKPWDPGIVSSQKMCYQPVQDCTDWLILSLFNNWNIIKFPRKFTTYEEFEEIHQVLLDDISDNMDSLVQYGKYGTINTTYKPTLGYYIVKYVSENHSLQADTKCDGKVVRLVN